MYIYYIYIFNMPQNQPTKDPTWNGIGLVFISNLKARELFEVW